MTACGLGRGPRWSSWRRPPTSGWPTAWWAACSRATGPAATSGCGGRARARCGTRCRRPTSDSGGLGLHVGPGALERLEQRVGRLGAGDAVAPAEHEERHALDAELRGEQLVLAHGVAVAAAVGDRERLLVGDAGLGGQAGERVRVRYRLAVGEVRAHEALLGGRLMAVRGGLVDHAV